MKEKELLKQALEALKTCEGSWEWNGEDSIYTPTYDERKVLEARNALEDYLNPKEEE